MENPNKVKKEANFKFAELESYPAHAKEKVIHLLKGLSKEEMIMRINQLDLSPLSLDYLCFGIALPNEDYEICAAVVAVKKLHNLN